LFTTLQTQKKTVWSVTIFYWIIVIFNYPEKILETSNQSTTSRCFTIRISSYVMDRRQTKQKASEAK